MLSISSKTSSILVTLFSDIATATSPARQCNGVVQRCAKAPRDVQNAMRAAEKSVTNLSFHHKLRALNYFDMAGNFKRTFQWQIQDSPYNGAPTADFEAKTFLLGKVFARNCMKRNEIGLRGVARSHSLDPSTHSVILVFFCILYDR